MLASSTFGHRSASASGSVSPAAARSRALATASASEPRLRAALARVRVAAIGPIVDEALAARGVRIDVMPEKAFVMRRLVDALAAALGPGA